MRCARDRLRIFDWNWVAAGPAEVDVAAFAEGIAADAGPAPERFVQEYRRHRALASASSMRWWPRSRVSSRSAWQPPPPDLPRVRSIQRRQARVCLAWAARRLGLAEPAWVAAIAD